MGDATALSVYTFSHFTKCHHVQSVRTWQRWTRLPKCLVNKLLHVSHPPFSFFHLPPFLWDHPLCPGSPAVIGPSLRARWPPRSSHNRKRWVEAVARLWPGLCRHRGVGGSGDEGGGRTVAPRQRFQVRYIMPSSKRILDGRFKRIQRQVMWWCSHAYGPLGMLCKMEDLRPHGALLMCTAA